MTSGSRTAVLAAISGNALLTVLKFGAAFVGHSASMMNEAVHSLVDTLNQVFLYLGLHFGSKPPDRQYAFGHGQKKYLWSAIGLFSIGCGLGLGHAWHAWAQLDQHVLPGQLLLPWIGLIDAVWVSLIVLIIALIVDLVVLRLEWRALIRQTQLEGFLRPLKHLFRSNDPTLLASLTGRQYRGRRCTVSDYMYRPNPIDWKWGLGCQFLDRNRIGTWGSCDSVGSY